MRHLVALALFLLQPGPELLLYVDLQHKQLAEVSATYAVEVVPTWLRGLMLWSTATAAGTGPQLHGTVAAGAILGLHDIVAAGALQHSSRCRRTRSFVCDDVAVGEEVGTSAAVCSKAAWPVVGVAVAAHAGTDTSTAICPTAAWHARIAATSAMPLGVSNPLRPNV